MNRSYLRNSFQLDNDRIFDEQIQSISEIDRDTVIHDRQSDFGGYLDIMLDFVVYAAIPLALMLAEPNLLRAGALLLASFFVNAASWMYLAAILERRQAGAAAQNELTTITMPPGIVAGAETVVFYTAMLAWSSARETLFVVMAALVMVNVGQRLWWARRHL